MTASSAQVVSARAKVGAAERRRRLCVLSEDLSGAPDEGVKNFALALARALAHAHDTAVLATEGPTEGPGAPPGVRLVRAPRTFLSAGLCAALRQQRPEVLFYVARASTTLWSFARGWVLKRYCPWAVVVLLGLQTRLHGWLQRRIIRHLAPDVVAVQSPAGHRYLAALGCAAELVPSGVDIETFRPVEPERRRALRAEYGLEPNAPVVLHVGHLQAGRGVGVLAELAARGVGQVVLVASSSTAQEAALAEELRRAGVTVVATYQPHVEHFYQLADCYVFPVACSENSIDAPLSVLEACACDLPVVSTRFGGLPRLFGAADRAGLTFVDTPAELVEATVRRCQCAPPSGAAGTRALALPYAWEAVGARLLDLALRKQR